MEEEKKVRITLQKHLWPDEVVAKRKRNRARIFITTGLLLTFVFGWVVGTTFAPKAAAVDTSAFSKLEAIYQTMSESWYFGKDIKDLNTKLIDNAINGMVDGGGDIHTSYMTSEEAKSFTESMNMGFVGIGVQYYDSDGTYIIERVYRESPAEKAGVLPGDIIHKVNGELMTNIGSDKLAEKVKGAAGTVVKIEFLREGKAVTLDITRAAIKNTAYGEMIDKETGLLELYTFGETSGAEVQAILKDFKAKGAKRLIIDLRDDGGGYLSTLEYIGSLFVKDDGILIQQEFRDGKTEITRSSGKVIVEWTKIVILVNKNTASAAEVLTAALSENLGSIVSIVGTQTYGKGTVQTQRPFPDQSILKYTLAQWLTPKGEKIDGVGITPNIIVELPAILEHGFATLKEGETVKPDAVNPAIVSLQEALKFIGYTKVDRIDGYYSPKTVEDFKAYQTSYKAVADGIVTPEWLSKIHSDVVRVWHDEMGTRDTQMKKALEVVHE
jgi:carboxyl-terminal processing protease